MQPFLPHLPNSWLKRHFLPVAFLSSLQALLQRPRLKRLQIVVRPRLRDPYLSWTLLLFALAKVFFGDLVRDRRSFFLSFPRFPPFQEPSRIAWRGGGQSVPKPSMS